MSLTGPYDTNDYAVYDEDGDIFLFAVEMNSAPALGSFIEHTLLSGPSQLYKVEKVVMQVFERVLTQPGPPPGPTLNGHEARPKVVVSKVVVP